MTYTLFTDGIAPFHFARKQEHILGKPKAMRCQSNLYARTQKSQPFAKNNCVYLLQSSEVDASNVPLKRTCVVWSKRAPISTLFYFAFSTRFTLALRTTHSCSTHLSFYRHHCRRRRQYPCGRVRVGYASCPLEVITEMPRAKHGIPGGGAGRRRQRQRRPYNDTGVTMVDEGHLPSSMAFRASGNESLFRFERGGRGGTRGGGEPPGAIVEETLRTARERTERRADGGGGDKNGRQQDLTFLTGVERQDDTDGGSQEDDDMVIAGLANGGDRGQGGGAMSTRLLRGPAVDPAVRSDPAKLQMALTALRYALKHPVMSSMDPPERRQGRTEMAGRGGGSGGGGEGGREGGAGRKTAAARARQLPRRPHRLVKDHEDIFARTLGGARGDRIGNLGRVDEVLTSMGVGLDEMVLEKRARGQNGHAQPGRPELSSIVRTVNAVMDENEY